MIWKEKMKINVALAAGCLFIAAFNCGCLDGEEGKTITMSMIEFINDYNESQDNVTKKITSLFNSLEEGDTLIIKDTINLTKYYLFKNYTLIELGNVSGWSFPIWGNITSTFKEGDTIELKLHIIKVTYELQRYNETWTVERETYEEGWDREYNTFISIDREHIKHASQ